MSENRKPIALYKKLLFSFLVFALFFYGLDRAAKKIVESYQIPVEGNSVLPGTVIQNTRHSFVDPDPTRIWALRPGETNSRRDISINSDGFRGEELPTAPEGSKKILMIGDSCAFGWGVGHEETIAVYLAEHLASKGQVVEVINAGVPGYSSIQCLNHLKEIFKTHQPDIVTLQIGWNDAWSTPSLTDSEIIENGPTLISFNFLVRKLWAVRLSTYILSKRYYEKFQKDPSSTDARHRVPVADYRENLAEIIQLCRDNGAAPILVNLPQRLPVGKPEIAPYLKALPGIAATNKVPIIDLIAPIQTTPTNNDNFFVDKFHFSAEGCQHTATIIGDALLEELLPTRQR